MRPGPRALNIPIFSLVWITSLAEHWLHSGRGHLFTRFRPTIELILQEMLDRHDEDCGLYRLSKAQDHWHFYEWTPGLANAPGDPAIAKQHHAAFNLYLHEALGAYAWMCHLQDGPSAATPIRRRALGMAIHAAFWEPRRRRCATRRIGKSRHDAHEHVQILSHFQGIVPPAQRARVLAQIYGQKLPSMTLNSLMYMVRTMLTSDPVGRQFLAKLIARRWEPMALQGATSFWETQHAGDDFFHAGSLCHGWSAAPVYYYQAGVLGITPIDPGFSRFRISPFPDRLAAASGTIPTPKGMITIQWMRRDRGLHVEASGPKGLEPVVNPLPEAPILRARYNGRSIRT